MASSARSASVRPSMNDRTRSMASAMWRRRPRSRSSSLINQDFVGVDGGAYPWQEGIVGHYVDGAVEELFQ